MEEINIFMNGTVVTRDDANRVIKDGVVVCQGDKIRSVGKEVRFRNCRRAQILSMRKAV